MAGNKLTVLKGQFTRYKKNGYLYQYKETLKGTEKQGFEAIINKENISNEEIEQVLKRLKDWCVTNNKTLSKAKNHKESNSITHKISMNIINFRMYIESIASNMNESDIELLKKQIEITIDSLNELKIQSVIRQLKLRLNELTELNDNINVLKLKLPSKI